MLYLKRSAFIIVFTTALSVFLACAGNDSTEGPNRPHLKIADTPDPGSEDIEIDSDNQTTPTTLDTIFFSSFENSSDLADWEGFSLPTLVADAPDGAGKKSVLISGGCVVPHAFLTLPPTGKDSRVSVKCYGKNLSNGGWVSVRIGDIYPEGIMLGIGEDGWNVYRSDKPLLWPGDSPLTIHLSSGGFVSGSMLIDELLITAK